MASPPEEGAGSGGPWRPVRGSSSYLRDAVLVDDLPDIPVFLPRAFPKAEGCDEGILVRQTLGEHVPGGRQRQRTPGSVRTAELQWKPTYPGPLSPAHCTS